MGGDHGHGDKHGHGSGHDDHGDHGEHGGHHHPHYDGFHDIEDHLKLPDGQELPVPATAITHDPWAFKYVDQYVNPPPGRWYHHKLRKQFGRGADVPDSLVKKYYAIMRNVWEPKWRVHRFDQHAWMAPWKNGKYMSMLTGGDATDDYVVAAMADAADHDKKVDREALVEHLEDSLYQCKREVERKGNHHHWTHPSRASQVAHRNCIFEAWAGAVNKGLAPNAKLDVPTRWLPAGWWGAMHFAWAGPAGPIKKTTFKQWWQQEDAVNKQVRALQLESHAVVHFLTTDDFADSETINGQPREEFLQRVEKHYRESIIPRQKEVFHKSVFGKDTGSLPLPAAELEKRRDTFFKNAWKTGTYAISDEEIEQAVPFNQIYNNNYARYYAEANIKGRRANPTLF